MYQQLWGYNVEEKLYLGVREQKRLTTTVLDYWLHFMQLNSTGYMLLSTIHSAKANMLGFTMARRSHLEVYE
jgi:hypothetical protein